MTCCVGFESYRLKKKVSRKKNPAQKPKAKLFALRAPDVARHPKNWVDVEGAALCFPAITLFMEPMYRLGQICLHPKSKGGTTEVSTGGDGEK